MIASGYNPQGMLRLQKKLSELEGHSKAAIFSTHPTSEKRYKAAEQLIAKLAPPADLLGRPVAALVGDEALAAVKAELRHAEDARIAEALKPDGGEVTAAALAPVGKTGFDAYAALENQLLYAGPKGKSKLLASNHLSETQLDQMTQTFTTRMRGNPALKQHYSAEFFRATQGRFAAHWRDLADSYEKNQPLQLDPPYPLETAGVLFAEMRKRGAPNLDGAAQAAAENEVLKPKGLTYYDFLIAHNWWSRKATIAELTGDNTILARYYGLALNEEDADTGAAAEDANVHVGDNVHVGKNVQVGGGRSEKPAAKADAD